MNVFLEVKVLLCFVFAAPLKILEKIATHVQKIKKTISTAVLKQWFDSQPTLQPTHRLAMLCDHPHSNTTLLKQMLNSHHNIVTAEETHILHDEAYLPLSKGFSPKTSVLQVLESAPVSALRQSRQDYFRFTEPFIGKA